MKRARRSTILTNVKRIMKVREYTCGTEIEKPPTEKVINMRNINPNIVQMQYAVRGPVITRAMEIEKEIEQGAVKPFKRVIKANIGDGHAMGQPPISFIRNVMACLSYPQLIDSGHFPRDVKKRALDLLSVCYGSVGSYAADVGIEEIRQSVAGYIEERDGHKTDHGNICLLPGASLGIKNCLQLFMNSRGKPAGVMVPIPQYPLYSASLSEYGLHKVDYYLDEGKQWGLTLEELERSFEKGSRSCSIRVLVVINPGNPTGQVLSKKNIETVIKFAHDKSLLIIADEVYQHNIYESEFVSFKKVLVEMDPPYNEVEVISYMSMSKGYMGECGIRAGWMEVSNMDREIFANFQKSIIVARQCPSTLGQATVDCVARPPKKGEESYGLFVKEKNEVLQALATRARMISDKFNKIQGFSCNTLQGAMYAFPRIRLPQKAIEAAKKAGQEPDVFYAFQLLEETGICVVPGSGFGQEPGTYHFRTTILPQTELLKEMLDMFETFQDRFIKKYS